MAVPSLDMSPAISRSCTGEGSEASIVDNVLDLVKGAIVESERPTLPEYCFSLIEWPLLRGEPVVGRRRRRIRKQTRTAAMIAPATAHPIPMPAAAPIVTPPW